MTRVRFFVVAITLVWAIGCSRDLATGPQKVLGRISNLSGTATCDELQDALDAANPGDVITIAEGSTCTGHFDLPEVTILLQGQGTVIFDGEGTTQILAGSDVGNTTIRNLTFKNGAGDRESGGAIALSGNSTPTVESSIFLGNSARDGGAVSIEGIGSDPAAVIVLNGNTFGSAAEPNSATRNGGAVHIVSTARVVLTGNRFVSNVSSSGGGFYVSAPSVTMAGNGVTGNTAGQGGGGTVVGFQTEGALPVLSLSGDIINNNSAVEEAECISCGLGGGLYLSAVKTTGSTVSMGGNSATSGGALYIDRGELSLLRSGLASNTASSSGGGIYADGAQVSVIGSTIASNNAGLGGGLYLDVGTELTLFNSTVADNAATTGNGGGLLGAEGGDDAGAVTITTNTIFARNLGPGPAVSNCAGNLPESGGHNLENGDTCGFNTVLNDGDLVGVDPLLGPRADNGGPTFTYALTIGSPAIDAGTNTGCAASDQRGHIRPQDGDRDNQPVCDIGAYELDNPNKAPAIVAPADLSINTDPGQCVAAGVSVGTPTVTDDAAGTTTVGVRDDAAALSSPFPKGTTTITWTVTDAGNLTAAASQVVLVADNELPTVVALPDRVVDIEPGATTAALSVVAATVADNCPGVLVAGPSGSQSFPIGDTPLNWIATDGSGNQASAFQTITVRIRATDTELPSIAVPASFTVNATMPTGAIVSFNTIATDNSGFATVSCGPVSGATYAIGVTTTTCTATDAAGNSKSANFTVTVLGAPEQIANLLEAIRHMAIREPHRTQLITTLRTVLSNPRSTRLACPALDLFVRVVRAKTPSYITPARSVQLIADASRIKDVLGCPRM